MRKIIRLIWVIGAIGIISIKPSLAFDRNAMVQRTRAVTISNLNYNINSVNISLNSGPTFVGSNDHSLPAYREIAQITAQIQQLKEKLKNFSPK